MRNRQIFDADHQALRESVTRYLATEPSTFFAGAAEYGFVGLAEADVRFRAVVLEEVMRAGRAEVALSLAMHDSFALPLLAGRAAKLAAVVDSDAVRAEVSTHGWALHGTAGCVVNGFGAEMLVVRAASDESSELLFVVEATRPGLGRDRSDALLGLDGLDVADLAFDGVIVTAADRLDAAALVSGRGEHQLALAVAAVAGAREALRMTVEYVQQRKAFGRPIATFENTRHVLGALGARVTAVEAFVDSCLAGSVSGALSPSTAAAARLTATEVLAEAVDHGVQLHGGYGYMWEYPIARAYAAARFFRLHGGSGAPVDDVLAAAVGL